MITKHVLTIAEGAAISDALDLGFDGARGAVVFVPGTWTAADIGFKVDNGSGTFLPLRDEAAGLVMIDGPAASTAYALPEKLINSASKIKLWSQNGSGVDTNQAAERVLVVVVRS
jgi:hypothetical protein